LRSRIIGSNFFNSAYFITKQNKNFECLNADSNKIKIEEQESNSFLKNTFDNELLQEKNFKDINNSFKRRIVKIMFIGTHADIDKSSSKKDDLYYSEKIDILQKMIQSFYEKEEFFNLDEKHIALDARAAWGTDIKCLLTKLIKLKQSICNRLPRSTMFLNRTLYHIQNWRKIISICSNRAKATFDIPELYRFIENNKYPVITWCQFAQQIRNCVNPLASDNHLRDLVEQLQLMGEVIHLRNSNSTNEMICYEPEWLCQKVLGRLFSHERYFNLKPQNLNGLYSIDELKQIYSDVCSNIFLIKDLFLSLSLCAEMHNEISGELIYEFPALNFLSEPLPLSFHTIKDIMQQFKIDLNQFTTDNINNHHNKPSLFIFNGFQIKTSKYHLNENLPSLYDNNNTALFNLNKLTSVMNSSIISNTSQKITNYSSTILAELFFRIQVKLRYLVNNYYMIENDIQEHKEKYSKNLNRQYLKNKSQEQIKLYTQEDYVSQSKLDNMSSETSSQNKYLAFRPNKGQQYDSSCSLFPVCYENFLNQSYDKLKTKPLIELNLRKSDFIFLNTNINSNSFPHEFISNKKNVSINNGTLIDIELYQTRYCSRLMRKNCHIECLLSLDHLEGKFIELRACAPDYYREELFYFVQDLYIFIEQVINQICSVVNLEKHYLSFKSLTIPNNIDSSTELNKNSNPSVVNHDFIFAPEDLIIMQYYNRNVLYSQENSVSISKNESPNKEVKFIDLVCCGSETIEKALTYGIDLPLDQMNSYTRRMLCIHLDKVDPIGRDWSILAFLLGMQDYLPRLDELYMKSIQLKALLGNKTENLSKCDLLLDEWSRKKPENATIRNLIEKLIELDRKDAYAIIMNTINPYIINLSKDSGIQNSNQTLI
jgi:hypothetical protein